MSMLQRRFFLFLCLLACLAHSIWIPGPDEDPTDCIYKDHIYQCFSRPDEPHTYGVAQKIDGSREEQLAVKHVLALMDEYMRSEVMTMGQYANIRHSWCVLCCGSDDDDLSVSHFFADSCSNNRNELCAFWAAMGECETNRAFMITNCAAACRLCLLLHMDIGDWGASS